MKLFAMAHQAKASSSLWFIKLKQVVELTLIYFPKRNLFSEYSDVTPQARHLQEATHRKENICDTSQAT